MRNVHGYDTYEKGEPIRVDRAGWKACAVDQIDIEHGYQSQIQKRIPCRTKRFETRRVKKR